MIELVHVEKKFAAATPLKDVNAVINKGDVISVIGPSGTGKSTLLRCINMLDPPTAGKIFVDGECITDKGCDLTRVRRKVGMVFQSFNLFGHLTVIENIMKPQTDLLGRSCQEAYDKGIALLKRVGMAGRALQYPEQLSGGQKQRVAIARALGMDPEMLLLDEPTSALDPTMTGEVETVIHDLAAAGTTMMVVTHEMRFAREICNRVFYMDQGGIYDDGTPEQIFSNPQKDRTRRFIKKLKTLEVAVESYDYDFQSTAYSIENYCYKNGISAADCMLVRLAFEELCQQLLLRQLSQTVNEPHLRFIFEYDPQTHGIREEICYNGAIYNPEQSGDDLSLSLLRYAAFDIRHEAIDENGYTNRLRLKIKSEA